MRRVSFTATLKLSRRLPNERPHLTKRSFVRHAFSISRNLVAEPWVLSVIRRRTHTIRDRGSTPRATATNSAIESTAARACP